MRSRHWAIVFATAASDRDLTPAALAELCGLPKRRIEKLLSAETQLMLTDVALLMKALAMSGEELAQRLQEESQPAAAGPVEGARV